MPKIYLARHGETDWNLRGKLQGHTDVPLNDSGRAQALALATRLASARLGTVTTSDLSRARETGAVVARALTMDEPLVDVDLRERAFGVFEGLTREECARRYPDEWRAWIGQTTPPAGAEPIAGAIARMTTALERVARRPASSPALVVSHGGLMRLWLQSVIGASLPLIANGTVYLVEHDGVVFRATRWDS
jgi:broad specificity phosphatase PhoE